MADTPPATTPEGDERAYLPPVAPPRNHGHTVAAWVTVSVIMVGAVVAAAAVVAANTPLFWVGMGVAVGGIVVGLVLRKAGFGQPDPQAPRRAGTQTPDA